MDISKKSYDPIKPLIRPDKNLVFKDKKYPIDFSLIKKYSNFFYNNRKYYKTIKDIQLQSDEYEICEESIPMFIACCQNQKFDITDSTVFSLYHLSIQYQVPELNKLSDEYIKKNHKNLVLQSIQFKIQNRNPEVNIDLSKEEEMISAHFFEYINDQLVCLPVQILYRIINGHHINFNSMNSTNQNQFIEFLFKCLDKHKREASVLFSTLDLENGRVDLLSRLLHDYSDVFDFGMINPKFFTKTFSELLSDISKLEIENAHKFSEMQSEIQKLQELYKIEFNSMKNKMIEMEAKIKEQSEIIEKFTQRHVQNITINAEKDFLFIGKPMTLTAKVTPANAFNKDVEWKIIQQDEDAIEIVEEDERRITIKAIKPFKKVLVSASSVDGSGVKAEKEFASYLKIDFNVSVQSNQLIIVPEIGVTFDKEKSRYLLNTDSSKTIGEKAYDSDNKFENLTQNVSFMKGKGTYYLHAIVFDNYGNSEEFVSNPLSTNGVQPMTFDYTGSAQSVELPSGDYKLEVWGA